jgi:hypothetical protein
MVSLVLLRYLGLTADAVLGAAATSIRLHFSGCGGSCPNVFSETFVALKDRTVPGAATQVTL